MNKVSDPLRCVVMWTDEGGLPDWVATCVQNLLLTRQVVLVGQVVLSRDDTIRNLGVGWSWRFLSTYRTILRRRVPALRRSTQTVLETPPAISLGSDGAWTQKTCDILRVMEPDVILTFHVGNGQIPQRVADLATYGVWSFQFGQSFDVASHQQITVPGLWEWLSGQAQTKVLLVQQGREGLYVLEEGWMHTDTMSMVGQVNRCLQFGLAWPAKICREIVSEGLAERPHHGNYNASASGSLLGLFGTLIWRRIIAYCRQLIRRWLSEHWTVGVIHRPIGEIISSQSFPEVEWLQNRERQGFMADPFALYDPDVGHLIFVEQYTYSQAKGNISVVGYPTSARNGKGAFQVQPVLDLPYHLSYPYLFRVKTQLYCVPESHQMRRVQLYRAHGSPCIWEQVRVLLDNFAAIDSTIFQYQGHWWLFCTNADYDANSHLYAFYADDVEGTWHPHLLNPIKSDVRSSRPAGQPFWHDGHLYRPAQDCSLTYGGQVVLNKVESLTPTKFSEKPVSVFAPLPNSRHSEGIHTFNSDGEITVIDAKDYRFVPSYIWGEVKKKLYRRPQAALESRRLGWPKKST